LLFFNEGLLQLGDLLIRGAGFARPDTVPATIVAITASEILVFVISLQPTAYSVVAGRDRYFWAVTAGRVGQCKPDFIGSPLMR
jgi:hypothetical protein